MTANDVEKPALSAPKVSGRMGKACFLRKNAAGKIVLVLCALILPLLLRAFQGQPQSGNVLRLAREAAVILPESPDKTRILSNLAGLYAYSDDLKTAREIVDSLGGSGSDRATAECVIAATLASQGKDSAGIKIAAGIADELERQKCFSVIGDSQVDRASTVEVNLVIQLSSALSDTSERARLLAHFAGARAQSGDPQSAGILLKNGFDALAAISDQSSRIEILEELAVAQSLAGQPETQKILDQVRQMIDAVDDPSTKRKLLTGLVVSYADIGNIEKALETASLLEPKAASDNALSEIAGRQLARGDLKGALNTLARIKNPSQRVSVLESIAVEEAKHGNLSSALKRAQEITYQPYKDFALAQIAGSQASLNQLQRALQTAERINDAGRRATTLGEIAYQAKDHTGACQASVMNKAFQLARSANSDDSLAEVARYQAQCRLIAEAQKTVNELHHTPARAEAMEQIAFVLASQKQADRVFEWIQQEKSPLVRAFSLVGIAEALVNPNPEKDLRTKTLVVQRFASQR